MIEELEIVSIRKIKNHINKSKKMYDLETEKNHNFFANGILVHNSGTNFRDDGNDMMINATCGNKCFDLSSKVLIQNGWLIKPQIKFIEKYMQTNDVKKLENKILKGLINETPEYNNFYEHFISNNDKRNMVIKEIIDQNKDKKILVLTRLVDHGQYLTALINGSKHLHGQTSKKEREKIFDAFTNGDLNILISTISIFAEGIDLPNLKIVINAAANKGNVKTIQVLGRILRKLEGKNTAQYYDFIDETKFFRLASLARKKALIKQGHEIEMIKNFI